MSRGKEDEVKDLAERQGWRFLDDASECDRGVVASAGAESSDLMVFGVSLEAGDEDNVTVLESGQKESRGNADDVGVAVVFVGDESGLPAA